MTITKKTLRQFPLLFFAIFFMAASAVSARPDVVLICNKTVAQDNLETRDIQQIYLGRKTRWSDNQKIQFVTMKEGSAHSEFLSDYISKTPSQYSVFWKKMIFTGQGKPPLAFDTPEEVVEYVSQTPGAIGYVPAGIPIGEVKVVDVGPDS